MLSIDISSKRVAIVDGVTSKGKLAITAFGEAELKDDIVSEGVIKDSSALSFMIGEIVATKKMKSKKAIVTISGGSIITREMKLPSVKLPDMQRLAKSEMVKITGSENDYVTDFVVNGKAGDNFDVVTVYAVPKDTVTSYMKLLKDARLIPAVMDIQTNAMAKLFSSAVINGNSHENDNVIIVDIGTTKINIHGFSAGGSRFMRTIDSPVQDLIRELNNIYRTEEEQSEILAKIDLTPGATFDSPVAADVCRYFVSRLADEIQKYNQYIIINSVRKVQPTIYICGAMASTAGIEAALTDTLDTNVSAVKDVEGITAPEDFDLWRYCKAVGAMIRK